MSGVRRGAQGTPTSGMEYSPERAKRTAAKRRKQQKRWDAKAGPVTVRKVGDPDPQTPPKPEQIDPRLAPPRSRAPRSVARVPSDCRKCGKVIEPGMAIRAYAGDWKHLSCDRPWYQGKRPGEAVQFRRRGR